MIGWAIWGLAEDARYSRNDIIDVGQVPLMLSMVEDINFFAFNDGRVNLKSAMSGRPHGP